MQKKIFIVIIFLIITFSYSTEKRLIAKGDHNYPPYEFLDANGEPAGFNVEILQAISERMDIFLKIELGIWSSIRKELEMNKIDIITGMFYSPERDSLLDFSLPHSIVSHTIFVRKNSEIKKIADIKNKMVLVQKDDIMHDYALKHKLTNSLITVENPVDALQLLSAGEYDCALLANMQGHHLIKENKLNNVVSTKDNINPRKYCFAVQEGNFVLTSRLNEGLNIIKTDGTYDRVYKKWFDIKSEKNFKKYLRYVVIVLIALAFFFVLIFFWNLSLNNKVNEKTRELAFVNKQLQSDIEQRNLTEKKLLKAQNDWEIIFEAIGHPTLILDSELRVLKANRAALKLFDTNLNSLKGQFCNELFQISKSSDEGCFADELKAEKNNVHEIEVKFLNKTFLINCTPVKNETGKVEKIIHISTDITALKKTQKALQQKESLLNMTEDLTKFGGWEWDVKTRIMYWTEETYRIHGIDPKEVKNGSEALIHRSLNCYSPKDRQQVKTAFDKCVSSGIPYDLEFKIRNYQKEELWIRTSAKAIRERGKITKIFGNFGDITKMKKTQQELEKHRENLEEMVKERTASLEKKNEELKKFNDLFVGRELRIKELKDRIKILEKK